MNLRDKRAAIGYRDTKARKQVYLMTYEDRPSCRNHKVK